MFVCVLSYFGIERSEEEISHVLGTDEEGTSLLNVPMLADAGWGATAGEVSFQELQRNVDQAVPVIVAVETRHLPHWKGKDNCLHAIVVIEYDDEFIYVNDPSLLAHPKESHGKISPLHGMPSDISEQFSQKVRSRTRKSSGNSPNSCEFGYTL